MDMTKQRRKTINDNLISSEQYDKLLGYTFFKLQDTEITQKDIINLLRPKGLSNTTIARIINDTITEARATSGSVASMIHAMDRTNTAVDELMASIDEEMM